MILALALMSRIFERPDGSGSCWKLSHGAPPMTREWLADVPSRWRVGPTVAYFAIVAYTAALFAREDMGRLLGEDLLVSACTLGFLGLFFHGPLRLLERDGCRRGW